MIFPHSAQKISLILIDFLFYDFTLKIMAFFTDLCYTDSSYLKKKCTEKRLYIYIIV